MGRLNFSAIYILSQQEPPKMELSPKQTSAIQALTLSNMEEGMGQCNGRAQGLQQDLAQRRASLSQESAKA